MSLNIKRKLAAFLAAAATLFVNTAAFADMPIESGEPEEAYALEDLAQENADDTEDIISPEENAILYAGEESGLPYDDGEDISSAGSISGRVYLENDVNLDDDLIVLIAIKPVYRYEGEEGEQLRLGNVMYPASVNIGAKSLSGEYGIDLSEIPFSDITVGLMLGYDLYDAYTDYIPYGYINSAGDTEALETNMRRTARFPDNAALFDITDASRANIVIRKKENDVTAAGVTGAFAWRIEKGTLYLMGADNMPDFSETDPPPWYEYRNDILGVKFLDNGATSVGAFAFYDMQNLIEVDLSDSITQICDGAFYNCASLEEIELGPMAKGSIGARAFFGCESLKEISIPQGVETMGAEAFSGCASLERVTLPFIGSQRGGANSRDSFWHILGEEVLPPLREVDITDETVVPENAFSGLGSIERVTLNIGVTEIGNGAFDGCASLKTFNMPIKISSVGDNTFRGCESLRTVSLPPSVKSIGKSAFEGCKRLQAISIPKGVSVIEEHTFKDCSSLSAVEIPVNVTNIGEGALEGCNGIISVKTPFVGANIDPEAPGSGNTSIFGYLFGVKTNAEIPPAVTRVEITGTSREGYIPTAAFKDCAGIEDIVIDGGRAVNDSAFANCKNLKNLYLPKSISNMGSKILAGCTQLETLTIPFIGKNRSDTGTETSVLGGFFGYNDKDLRGTMQYYTDQDFHIYSVPRTLKSVSVLNHTDIPEGAFMECDFIEKVAIVTGATMNKRAFYHCSSLKSVTLPNSLQTIGSQAFAECEALEEVNIPNKVKSIGEQVFYNCYDLKNVTMPDSVTEIADDVFIGTNLSLMGAIELMDAGGTITCSQGSAAYNYAVEHNIKTNVVPSGALNVKKTSTTINLLSDGSYMIDVIDAYNMRGTLHVELYGEKDTKIAEKTAAANDVEYRMEFSEERISGVQYVKIYVENGGKMISTEDEILARQNGDIPNIRVSDIVMTLKNGEISFKGTTNIRGGLTLVEALYDEDGRMTGMNTYSVTSLDNTVQVSDNIEGRARYMLWSSVENIRNWAKAVENK